MANGNHSFSVTGNTRVPTRAIQWLLKASFYMPTHLIRDSFKGFVIAIDVTSKEDHCIHCLKLGQPCSACLDLTKNISNPFTEDDF